MSPKLPARFAVFLCTDHDGNVLLAQRAGKGWWYGGSGTVEPGEVPAATARREIMEEFGCPVSWLWPMGARTGRETVEGQKEPWEAHDFHALVDRRLVFNAEPKEHSDLRWVTGTEIWPKPQHPLFPEFLKFNLARILVRKPYRPAPVMR